jgi:hypothetical protein
MRLLYSGRFHLAKNCQSDSRTCLKSIRKLTGYRLITSTVQTSFLESRLAGKRRSPISRPSYSGQERSRMRKAWIIAMCFGYGASLKMSRNTCAARQPKSYGLKSTHESRPRRRAILPTQDASFSLVNTRAASRQKWLSCASAPGAVLIFQRRTRSENGVRINARMQNLIRNISPKNNATTANIYTKPSARQRPAHEYATNVAPGIIGMTSFAPRVAQESI